MTKQLYRVEKDFLGELNIHGDALYGIHSLRAKNNFPDSSKFKPDWFTALGSVKKACYLTAKDFFHKASEKLNIKELNIRTIPENKIDALISAANEIEQLKFFDDFIVPAISGGAGTSINLNINEIITNRALQILGHKPGEYQILDPIEDANIFQSTNDVVPTALKVAVISLLTKLEEKINATRFDIENLEKQHKDSLKKGYTQMQEAVPTSFGRLFSTYSDALSRDWWRVSKCFERIKVVNIGGSAIGSAITVPRYFNMEVTRKLQEITKLPVTKSDNLYDATNNLDALVEIHGILKAHAVNLEKIVSDLRLLSSDLMENKTVEIPQKQVGSSIMPGKVNPVIPEFVISCSHKIYSNDILISSLSAQGCLELNAYWPIIGHHLIDTINLLIACNETIKLNLISNLKINSKIAEKSLYESLAITTALVPFIGYNKSARISRIMKEKKCSVFDANKELGFLDNEKIRQILSPEKLLQNGFTLKDITEI